jgi:hypothetical protein
MIFAGNRYNDRVNQVIIFLSVALPLCVCSCSSIGSDSEADVLRARVLELEEFVSVLSDSMSAHGERIASAESRLDEIDVVNGFQSCQIFEMPLPGRNSGTSSRATSSTSLQPDIGEWSDGSGHQMNVTSSTLTFSGDGLDIAYEDVTIGSNGYYFILEVQCRSGSFFDPFLVLIFEDENLDLMHMQGYDSYEDAFMAQNRGTNWWWSR